METIRIKRLSEDALLPVRATDGAACFDLYVPKDTPVSKGRNIIPLDFAIELPEGTYADIRPRSGFSAKGVEDITGCRRDADVLLGTIDCDYRGNVGVIIRSEDYFVVSKGTRIAVSISVLVIDLFIFSVSSWFSLERSYLSKNLSISKLSTLLAYSCL